MHAELTILNHCAAPFLSCAAVNLSWYDSVNHKRILIGEWKPLNEEEYKVDIVNTPIEFKFLSSGELKFKYEAKGKDEELEMEIRWKHQEKVMSIEAYDDDDDDDPLIKEKIVANTNFDDLYIIFLQEENILTIYDKDLNRLYNSADDKINFSDHIDKKNTYRGEVW